MTIVSLYVGAMSVVENGTVERFRTATVLSRLGSIPETVLEQILLQRRLFALEGFERVYNHALCGFIEEKAKKICRKVILDEYPQIGPNHREDAVHDMMLIGMNRTKILGTVITDGTTMAVEGIVDLVRYKPNEEGNHPLFDIQGAAALRMYETLAGEETEMLFYELKRRYGLTEDKSHYYWPHVIHDKKRVPLGKPGETHADLFGILLPQLVDSEKKCSKAIETIRRAGEIRIGFYRQFE